MKFYKYYNLATCSLLSILFSDVFASEKNQESFSLEQQKQEIINNISGKVKKSSLGQVGTVQGTAEEDKKQYDEIAQKIKKAIMNVGVNQAGKLLSYTHVNQKKYMKGVVSKVLSFERKNSSGEEQTWAVIGYTDGSVTMYQPDLNTESPYYLGPQVTDSEKCFASKGADDESCKTSFENFQSFDVSNLMADGKNYNVTSLAYIPNITNNEFSKMNGTLLIGYGRDSVLTSRFDMDVQFSDGKSFGNLSYGRKKETEGGYVAAIPVYKDITGSIEPFTLHNAISDYGVKNIYSMYKQDPDDGDTLYRTIVIAFEKEVDNLGLFNAGFQLKDIGGFPVPVPSTETLNYVSRFIFHGHDPIEKKVMYKGFNSEISEGLFDIQSSKGAADELPTSTYNSPTKGIFEGYKDGGLYYIHIASENFRTVSLTPLVYRAQNQQLDSAVISQSYHEGDNFLLSSSKNMMKLIHFTNSYEDQIDLVQDFDLKDFGENISPAIYHVYRDKIFILMTNGLLVSIRYDNTDPENPKFIAKSDYDINKHLPTNNKGDMTPLSMDISHDGHYLAVSYGVNNDYSNLYLYKVSGDDLTGEVTNMSEPDKYSFNHSTKIFPKISNAPYAYRDQYGHAGNLQFIYDHNDVPEMLTYTIIEEGAPSVYGGKVKKWGAVVGIEIKDGFFTNALDQVLQSSARCSSIDNDDYLTTMFCFQTKTINQ